MLITLYEYHGGCGNCPLMTECIDSTVYRETEDAWRTVHDVTGECPVLTTEEDDDAKE